MERPPDQEAFLILWHERNIDVFEFGWGRDNRCPAGGVAFLRFKQNSRIGARSGPWHPRIQGCYEWSSARDRGEHEGGSEETNAKDHSES